MKYGTWRFAWNSLRMTWLTASQSAVSWPASTGQPPVGVLRDHAEVRRDDDELRALVPCLGDEMDVGGPRHAQVGADGHDVLGVEPVGALADVGLVAPDLGERVRQIGVPVVEAHVHAAEELEQARARRRTRGTTSPGSARSRRRDRAPTSRRCAASRRRRSRAPRPRSSAGSRPCRGPSGSRSRADRVVLDRRPCLDRLEGAARLAPEVGEHAPDVRVLDPDRAVDVPGGRDAPLAAARLVGRQLRLEQRVVGRLHLPGDDAVLDVDHPGAAAGAVDAVRRANGSCRAASGSGRSPPTGGSSA